jgi:hypothetical protein
MGHFAMDVGLVVQGVQFFLRRDKAVQGRRVTSAR